MPTQVSLLDGALASAGTLAIQTNGTTSAITISSAQVATFVNNPIMTGLTASRAVFTDGSKGLTSNAITGTGNVVMSASPTLTGTIDGAALTLSSSLTLSGGTANGVAYLNGSKVLTSGSALTFDGTNFSVGSQGEIRAYNTANTRYGRFVTTADGTVLESFNGSGEPLILSAPQSSAYIGFKVNSSEQMRLTSTGLGIGTSSITSGAKLDVNGQIVAQNGTNSSLGYAFRSATTTGMYVNDDGVGANLVLQANGSSNYAYLSRTGNLGLGVTPSAWNTVGKGFDFGSIGGVWSSSSAALFSANGYYGSAGWKYKTTAAATLYEQSGGTHVWQTAPSGTAGNTITFTQAMTLDASGNLGVGTTSPGAALELARASADVGLYITRSSSGAASYQNFIDGSGDIRFNMVSSTNMRFFTANTERARIDSSGNLLVGTTGATSNSRLAIKGSSTSASDLNFFFVNSAGSTVLAAYNNGALYADNMKSGAGTNAVKFSTSTGQITYDTSSARYKDNIRDSIYGLSHVMQMRSTQFEYKDDGRSDVGLIAEELDPIIPELVGKNKDGQPDSVSYDRMVSVLVKAIQEQQALIQQLQADVAALKGA